MPNTFKVMDSIKNFLVKMKALDESIPEELAEDALKMTEEVKDALCESEVEEKFEEKADDENAIEAKVEDAMVKVMKKYGLIKDESMESLDKLDECEVKDEDGEEEVYTDPEKMNDDARKVLLRKIKPMVASIKDASTRKKFADAFAEALSINKGDQYGDIAKMTKMNAKDRMYKNNDSVDMVDFGMQIAEKFNPHYKKEG